jgi:hypothetical protein
MMILNQKLRTLTIHISFHSVRSSVPFANQLVVSDTLLCSWYPSPTSFPFDYRSLFSLPRCSLFCLASFVIPISVCRHLLLFFWISLPSHCKIVSIG